MIRLEMNDWLYNCGLIGLYRVLKHNNDYVEVKANYIEFEESALDDFGTKYFKYLIDKYENNIRYSTITKSQNIIRNFKEEEFNEDELKKINKTISSAKKILQSNSYNNAYNLLKEDDVKNIDELVCLIDKLEKVEEIDIDKVKEQLNILNNIIEYIKQDDIKFMLCVKDIQYTYINKFYENISFLNVLKSKLNAVKEFNLYFIDSIKQHLNKENVTKKKSNKEDTRVFCINCNEEVDESRAFSLSHLKMNVSDRKSNQYWNSNYNIYTCPICNLVYACITHGFNSVYSNDSINSIFVNQNSSFDKLIKANNINISDSDTLESLENKSYFTIINTIKQNEVELINKEIDNIQIIKKSNYNYKFNIMSKHLLKIISKCANKLEKLINYYVKIDNKTYNIYNEVIKRLYNNRNLNDLIFMLVREYLKREDKYILYYLSILIYINNERRGESAMNNKQLYYVKKIGEEVRAKYVEMNATNKINSIVYKLLNAVKTKNKNMFMNIIIRVHMYTNVALNDILINALSNNDDMTNIAHAYILALLGNKDKEEAKKDEQ